MVYFLLKGCWAHLAGEEPASHEWVRKSPSTSREFVVRLKKAEGARFARIGGHDVGKRVC